MPLDEEMLEAMRSVEIELREPPNTVSGRFAFWTIFLALGFLVMGLVLRWNGY